MRSTSGQQKNSILSGVFCAAYLYFGFVLLVECLGSLPAVAQTSPSVVPICEVLESPKKFDKQTLQLSGYVLFYFEDFTLHSVARCPTKSWGIWLAFGDDVAGPTMSAANATVRRPGVPKFGGFPISVIKDDTFEKFFELINARKKQGPDDSGPLYSVTATLTGLFLAGNTKLSHGKPELPGYGHMDAFHLFVITRVEPVDALPPPQLDSSGTVTDEDGEPSAGVEGYAETAYCCQSWLNQDRSDETGHFGIKNGGQVLTFLKTGYNPRSLVLETGGADIRVVLERKPADDWRIPVCKGSSSEHRFSGLPLSMAMPKGVRIKRFRSGSFAIHGKTRYSIFVLSKGNPRPLDEETAYWLFGSEKFVQRNVVNAEGKTIGLDSRGVQGNGESWRVVTIPGNEIVRYFQAVPETANIFDGIIDSACFQPEAPTH